MKPPAIATPPLATVDFLFDPVDFSALRPHFMLFTGLKITCQPFRSGQYFLLPEVVKEN